MFAISIVAIFFKENKMKCWKKVSIILAMGAYVLIGNGLGRMSWDVYHGVPKRENFGHASIYHARVILFPSCVFITDVTECNAERFSSDFPLIVVFPRAVYLGLMTFFWLLKIMINVIGLFIGLLLVLSGLLINSFLHYQSFSQLTLYRRVFLF